MSKYVLLEKVTAVQIAPGPSRGPFRAARPYGPTNPDMPPLAQQFSIELNGVGVCSATVQLLGSNDWSDNTLTGLWTNYMDPIIVTSNAADLSPGVKPATGNAPWKFLAAYVTAISGTNASVNVVMSA